MYAYGHFLMKYEDSPYVQSAIVGVVYPGVVVSYKLFLLGKYGGGLFFGDSVHLNEEWHRGNTKKMAYSSIVRSIHGMYFPQSVGLFLLYFSSLESFILTCTVRIFWNAVVKVITFYGDEQAAIMIAKHDGVYDKDDKLGTGKEQEEEGCVQEGGSPKPKKPSALRHSSTVSQEAAKKESYFGHMDKQPTASTGGNMSPSLMSPGRMPALISGINSDYNSNMKSTVISSPSTSARSPPIYTSPSLVMVPIMSSIKIGETKVRVRDGRKERSDEALQIPRRLIVCNTVLTSLSPSCRSLGT